MNRQIVQARAELMDYLGLKETETRGCLIRCDSARLPRVTPAMRPQLDTRGRFPHMHTATRHQRAMDEIAARYRAVHGSLMCGYSGPVILSVISHRQAPQSWTKRRIGEQDTMKPDASNIIKLVEDALNGIAYHDDSQIVAALPIKAPRRGSFDYYELEVTYCEPIGRCRLPLEVDDND